MDSYAQELIDALTDMLNNNQSNESQSILDSLHSEIYNFISIFVFKFKDKSMQYMRKIVPLLTKEMYLKYLNHYSLTEYNKDQKESKFKIKENAIEWAAKFVVQIWKSNDAIQEYKEEFVSIAEAIMTQFSQGSFIDLSLNDSIRRIITQLK